jgi:hypothetical protein
MFSWHRYRERLRKKTSRRDAVFRIKRVELVKICFYQTRPVSYHPGSLKDYRLLCTIKKFPDRTRIEP